MSDDRPGAYREGGVAIYRASSVGLCEVALIALRMGVQPSVPPDWLQEKFDEGHEWEGHIVEQAADHQDLTIINTQEVVEVDLTPTIRIRGATDGRALRVVGGYRPEDAVGQLGIDVAPRLFARRRRERAQVGARQLRQPVDRACCEKHLDVQGRFFQPSCEFRPLTRPAFFQADQPSCGLLGDLGCVRDLGVHLLHRDRALVVDVELAQVADDQVIILELIAGGSFLNGGGFIDFVLIALKQFVQSGTNDGFIFNNQDFAHRYVLLRSKNILSVTLRIMACKI